MKLIVGLGNPGERYAHIRHNLGFMVLDEYVSSIKYQVSSWKFDEKLKSEVAEFTYTKGNNSPIREFANQFLSKSFLPKESEKILLAKPLTFMNQSGLAVKLLTTYYKIPTIDLIVVYDELDLPLGKIKVRIGGAAAGHHGVESIINHLGTDQFIRVRLGIGNLRTLSGEHKGRSVSAEKFVLEPFTHSEKPQVKHMIKLAIKAVGLLLGKGLKTAQNQFN